jgi:hypothetical protein
MRCFLQGLALCASVTIAAGCSLSSRDVDHRLQGPADPVRPEIALKISPDSIQLGQDATTLTMNITVTWTGEAPWEGTAPTSMLYDFAVARGNDEAWRWSEELSFAQAITPVTIPAQGTLTYAATWEVPSSIQAGSYTVTGRFIPAQIEASQSLRVFAKK